MESHEARIHLRLVSRGQEMRKWRREVYGMARKWPRGRDKMLQVFRGGKAYYWLEESGETSWRSGYLTQALKDGKNFAGRGRGYWHGE